MKTYTIILTLACAYQVASAAVTIYQVPRPPTEANWFANSTEFDFDGNSAFDIVVLEGNTQSIGNEVSIRSSTGFRVDFGTSVQVFASTEVSQVLHGTMIGESILGTDGGWAHWNSLYFEYHYGTAGSGYNTDLISEQFAVPVRLMSGSDYRYGFIDISMLEQTLNWDGSTSENIRPHVVGIGLETDTNMPVSTFAIPEPSCILLVVSGLWAFVASRRRKGEQGGGGNAHELPSYPSTTPSESRATP